MTHNLREREGAGEKEGKREREGGERRWREMGEKGMERERRGREGEREGDREKEIEKEREREGRGGDREGERELEFIIKCESLNFLKDTSRNIDLKPSIFIDFINIRQIHLLYNQL